MKNFIFCAVIFIEDLKNISTSQDEQNNEIFREEDDFDTSPPKFFGKEKEYNKLVVMGDVSGFADRSQAFASFLTVTRKLCYSCIYNLHIIYPEKAIWKLILSQIQTFDLFLRLT